MDHDGGHGAIELGAALILVVGGALLTAVTVRTRQARPGLAASAASGRGPHVGRSSAAIGAATLGSAPAVHRSVVLMLATLSLGAATIHLVAAPPHFAEIGDAAMGFVIVAAFQAGWVRWCLAGPTRRAAVVGIAGNVAIIAAWAWTRTLGLPGAAGRLLPEPVGLPDGASVLFELLLVAGLVAWLTTARLDTHAAVRLRAAVRPVAAIAVVPVLGLVMILTSLATIAIASGLDHGSPFEAPGAPLGMDHAARH